MSIKYTSYSIKYISYRCQSHNSNNIKYTSYRCQSNILHTDVNQIYFIPMSIKYTSGNIKYTSYDVNHI